MGQCPDTYLGLPLVPNIGVCPFGNPSSISLGTDLLFGGDGIEELF